MIYPPPPFMLPPTVVTPFSVESMGSELVSVAANPTSGAWPSANRALYVPFRLTAAAVVRKVFWANGATAAGNVDMGIFASTSYKPSTLLTSVGSTAQTGTDTLQVTDIADIPLVAGTLYYMALVMSSGSATVYRFSAPIATILTMFGMCQSTTSLPLTASPSIATLASPYLPMFGITFDTTAVL